MLKRACMGGAALLPPVVCLVLTLALCIHTVPASATPPQGPFEGGDVFRYTKTLKHCSGAVVRSQTAWQGNSYFVTARHCHKRSQFFEDAKAGDPKGNGVLFTFRGAVSSAVQDITVAPIRKLIGRVRQIPLAQRLPQRGERITMRGYPIGNNVSGSYELGLRTHLSEFDCVYMGSYLDTGVTNGAPSDQVKIVRDRLVVFQQARCDYHKFVDGASGGPLMNANGEYIGMLSALIGSDKHTYILFSEMTESKLAKIRNGLATGDDSAFVFGELSATNVQETVYRYRPKSNTIFMATVEYGLKDSLVHGAVKTLDGFGNVVCEELADAGRYSSLPCTEP